MKKMVAVVIAAYLWLVLCGLADARGRLLGRRQALGTCSTGPCAPAGFSACSGASCAIPGASTTGLQEVADALDEVNAARAQRGLRLVLHL